MRNAPFLLRVLQPVLAFLVRILLNLGRQLTVLDFDLFLVLFLVRLVASVLCSYLGHITFTKTEKYSLSCHVSNLLLFIISFPIFGTVLLSR